MNLPDYQFRTNWLGQCILQRRALYTNGSIGWIDCTAQDLRDYYQELIQLQPLQPPPSQQIPLC